MKAIVLAAVLSVSGFALAQMDHSSHKAEGATTQPTTKPVNAKCPVSGDPVDARYTVNYEGKTVGFCCPDCLPEFKKDPEKYMKKLQ